LHTILIFFIRSCTNTYLNTVTNMIRVEIFAVAISMFAFVYYHLQEQPVQNYGALLENKYQYEFSIPVI